jgi:hypothetical protein
MAKRNSTSSFSRRTRLCSSSVVSPIPDSSVISSSISTQIVPQNLFVATGGTPPLLPGLDDASLLSMKHILWIRKHEINYFDRGLDFLWLDNMSLKELFPLHKKDFGHVIPFEYRHTSKKIREFQRMGVMQQKLIVEKDKSSNVYNNQPVVDASPSLCFGLRNPDLCEMTYSDDKKVSITNGYNHLVREALRKRADIISDNTYH